MIDAEDLYFSTPDGERLHVRHYVGVQRGPQRESADRIPVLLVHGAVENGRIFYSESGKGLATYLADQGFDPYVLIFGGGA